MECAAPRARWIPRPHVPLGTSLPLPISSSPYHRAQTRDVVSPPLHRRLPRGYPAAVNFAFGRLPHSRTVKHSDLLSRKSTISLYLVVIETSQDVFFYWFEGFEHHHSTHAALSIGASD